MPKVVVKNTEPVPNANELWRTLTWEVEDQIDASPYRTGKLKLHGAVVGEITLLRQGFSTVAQKLCELGVRVVVDYVPLTKIMSDIRERPPMPKKGQLGYKETK